MSKFKLFMRENKIAKENTTYAPTTSLLDENGEPLKFEIRALTTREDNNLRDKCTEFIPIKGKPNNYNPKFNSADYICKMLCACIVYPDLRDKELQDSYDVMTPEDLLLEMIDNPVEYDNFATFVRDYNGLDKTFEDKVNDAKN